jgi:hypothetical protein
MQVGLTSELNALKALCTEKDTDLQQLRLDHNDLIEEFKEFMADKKALTFRLIDQFKAAENELKSLRTQVCLCICICLCVCICVCLDLCLRLCPVFSRLVRLVLPFDMDIQKIRLRL